MSDATQPAGRTWPFARFEWLLSMRYLRARRRDGFISVIAGFSFAGIMLGVATLIIVMAVMNGFRSELLGRILGLNGHMAVRLAGGAIPDFDAVNARLMGIPGVVRVTPLVDGQVMASSAYGAAGAIVRGIRAEDITKITLVADNIQFGTLNNFDEGEGIAVGTRLAQRLGVSVGDSLTLLSPRGSATPFGTAPRVKAYTVAALFEVGMSEFDASFIFMPLHEAQRFFKLGDAVSALEIMIHDPDRVGDMIVPVVQAAGPQFDIYTWQQTNASLFSALQVERNVMFLILTLILLVAVLNIVSGLIMLVKDKGRDIAVLRTMGASRGAVMRVFFISGASIGVVGTLAGLILGTLFCTNIETLRQWLSWLSGTELFSPEVYFLSHMPAEMNPVEVLSIVAMALGLSFGATLYPAWRAASLDPVEALRYE